RQPSSEPRRQPPPEPPRRPPSLRGLESEEIAGLAVERLADRLERAVADRPHVVVLQQRQVRDGHTHLLAQLRQRHVPLRQQSAQLAADARGLQLRTLRSLRRFRTLRTGAAGSANCVAHTSVRCSDHMRGPVASTATMTAMTGPMTMLRTSSAAIVYAKVAFGMLTPAAAAIAGCAFAMTKGAAIDSPVHTAASP